MADRKHSETRQRTRLVCVRMTPAEYDLLAVVAADAGKDESTLLRDAFLAGVTPKPATAEGTP